MLNDSAILDRVLKPLQRGMTEKLARAVLSLDFTARDQARYQVLAVKANRGTLSAAERTELERFLAVNDFLTILKAEARILLKRKNRAA